MVENKIELDARQWASLGKECPKLRRKVTAHARVHAEEIATPVVRTSVGYSSDVYT